MDPWDLLSPQAKMFFGKDWALLTAPQKKHHHADPNFLALLACLNFSCQYRQYIFQVSCLTIRRLTLGYGLTVQALSSNSPGLSRNNQFIPHIQMMLTL